MRGRLRLLRRRQQRRQRAMADLSAPLTGGDESTAGAPAASLSHDQQQAESQGSVAQNLLAGATTSFAAIALGAAFGDASGRGALVGILSAGVIATTAAILGGPMVQCSGPTAPMTAVTTLVVTYSRNDLLQSIDPSLNITNDFDGSQYTIRSPGCIDPHNYIVEDCPLPDRFVNTVILMSSVLIVLMGVTRAGEYIGLVPNVVISGFMNGIAVQIWQKEVIKVWGTLFDSSPRIQGDWILNIAIVLVTTVLCFKLPGWIKRFVPPQVGRFMPATLWAILIVTTCCLVIPRCPSETEGATDFEDDDMCVEKTKLGATLDSFDDLVTIVRRQFPTYDDMNMADGLVFWPALKFAIQLAPLAYLVSW